MIFVTKCDGDLVDAAHRAVGESRAGTGLMQPRIPGWTVPVIATSALHDIGIDQLAAGKKKKKNRSEAASARCLHQLGLANEDELEMQFGLLGQAGVRRRFEMQLRKLSEELVHM